MKNKSCKERKAMFLKKEYTHINSYMLFIHTCWKLDICVSNFLSFFECAAEWCYNPGTFLKNTF